MILRLRCWSNIYIQPVHDPYARRVILRGRKILHKNCGSDEDDMTDRLQWELAEPSVAGAKTVLYCPSQAMIGWDRAKEREGGGKQGGREGDSLHSYRTLRGLERASSPSRLFAPREIQSRMNFFQRSVISWERERGRKRERQRQT